MIDIKELRVGAHIKLGNAMRSVLCIDALNVCIGIEGNIVERYDIKYAVGNKIDELDPIPITAALLDELGFEPIRKTLGKHDEEWHMELDGYLIRVMRGESDTPEREWSVHIDSWDYDVFGVVDVAYLHQLENIIYLCTGKELIKEGE